MPRRPLMSLNFRKNLEPFSWLHREMDDFFDHFWRPSHLYLFSDQEFLLAPDGDVSETDNEIIEIAALPGLEEKDINTEISDNVLRISREKKIDPEEELEEEEKNFHHVES